MNSTRHIRRISRAERWTSRIAVCMCIVAAMAFVSCSISEQPQPTVRYDKVVLFYMGGDNNLSGEVQQKIDAISRGWQPAGKQKLLIYADAAGIAPRLLEMTGGGNHREIRSYADSNSADWRIFSSVIDEVRQAYPADSYGLVVFSHATGWLPSGAFQDPVGFTITVADWEIVDVEVVLAPEDEAPSRSIIVDGRSEMELSHFAQAIPDGMFDYIVFEACFMAGVEVAYQLKDKTDYIMASSAEILSPGFIEAYARNTDLLFGNDITAFGKEVFRIYDSESGHRRSATFSVIKTSALDGLAAWIRDNRVPRIAVNINAIQHFDRNTDRLFFDFGDYCRTANSGADTDELDRLLDNCVVWKAATPEFLKDYNGFDITSHSGLTTYIPQSKFERLNKIYTTLDWYKDIR